MKKVLHKIFHDHNTRAFRLTNDFFAILTIVSIIGIVLETVEGLAPYSAWFAIIEWGTVAFFTAEYIGRLIAADKKLSYIFSFFGLIDLLAILPTYFGLTNFTFLKSVRILRILRFLRMLRLAKAVRPLIDDAHKHEPENGAYNHHSLTIQIYFAALSTAVVLSATLLWFVEGAHHADAANIPLAMLWSAKVLLGGVTQAQPVTVAGDIVIIITRFFGLALFGLLINVVGMGLKQLLFGDDAN